MTVAAPPRTRPTVTPRAATSVLVGLALLLALEPYLIVTAARIWAPSAMIQEMFSHAFATPLLMAYGTHFVPVGHFFALYTALPNVVANGVLASASAFDRAQAFTVGVYLLHGAVMFGLFLVGLRLTPALHERLALLLVAFGQGWLMRFTNLRLTVNYDLLVNVIFMVLALVWIWRTRSERQSGRGTAILLGVVAGVIVGTKYSILVLVGPFLLLMLLPRPPTLGTVVQQGLWSALTMVLTAAILMVAYFHGRLDFLASSLVELWAYHASPLVNQSTPFMLLELRRWLDPSSYYFGLQALVTVWAVLLVATAVLVSSRRGETLLVVAASLFGAALLAYTFNQRRTGGTTLDVSMFLLFDVAVLATCWRDEVRRLVVPRVAVGLLCGAAVLSVVMMHPVALIDRLAANSQQARAFEAWRQARPDLPIVYYMSGFPQPLTFPTIDLYAFGGLQATPVTAAYMRDIIPRATFRGPQDGLLPGPQLIVIPEYLEPVPETPADRVEWPDMYRSVDTQTTHPAFGERVRRLGANCQVFQFRGEDPTTLHHLWVYPTRVTACVDLGS